ASAMAASARLMRRLRGRRTRRDGRPAPDRTGRNRAWTRASSGRWGRAYDEAAVPARTGNRRFVHSARGGRSAAARASDHALGEHRVGHLHEAGDVGAVDVADAAVLLAAVAQAG